MEIAETPIEFLKNLRREVILTNTGFGAFIRYTDLFIKMAEEHPECLVEHPTCIDKYLELRKSFMNFVDDGKIKIKLLDEEIAREMHSPNEAPMIYRLIMLFGHL